MTPSEEFYRIAAEDMVRTAAQAMRSANEFLRLATEARLRAEREALGSPFAGSRDPGALPGAFGSRSSLRSVS